MMHHKTIGIIFLISAGLTVLLFCLSWLNPIIKTISFAFLSITLSIMAFVAFKAKRENKDKRNHSDIDSMLGNTEESKTEKKEKISFWERSEVFGNGLIPYALAFFAIVSFFVTIMMIA